MPLAGRVCLCPRTSTLDSGGIRAWEKGTTRSRKKRERSIEEQGINAPRCSARDISSAAGCLVELGGLLLGERRRFRFRGKE